MFQDDSELCKPHQPTSYQTELPQSTVVPPPPSEETFEVFQEAEGGKEREVCGP